MVIANHIAANPYEAEEEAPASPPPSLSPTGKARGFGRQAQVQMLERQRRRSMAELRHLTLRQSESILKRMMFKLEEDTRMEREFARNDAAIKQMKLRLKK